MIGICDLEHLGRKPSSSSKKKKKDLRLVNEAQYHNTNTQYEWDYHLLSHAFILLHTYNKSTQQWKVRKHNLLRLERYEQKDHVPAALTLQ